MEPDLKSTLDRLYPMPEGVKLRTRKLGKNPESQLVSTPTDAEIADSGPSRSAFTIHWEDKEYGLSVLVRESQETGHLVADVFCTDAGQLNNLAVSVALVGTIDNQMIRRTIPLGALEKAGCSGSADFGPLTEAVKKLGSRLRIVVFMLV
jgi:hypothetical protein